MSMYNMIFGVNPAASLVLALLEKPHFYFGRFRDAWIEKLEDESLRLAVLTRNGGGNREHYNDCAPGPECQCPGCIINFVLPNDPNYIEDKDDAYDCTYALVYFKVPEGAFEKLREKFDIPQEAKLEDVAVAPVNMSERWQDGLEMIKNMKPPSQDSENK